MESDNLLRSVLEGNQTFSDTLKALLRRHGMTLKEFSAISGVPTNTLYKITTDPEKDFRTSTLKQLVHAAKKLEGTDQPFIAVITSRSVLDRLKRREVTHEGTTYRLREFPAINIEEVITTAARAEREGARGIICGPIASASIRNVVTIPVAALLLDENSLEKGLDSLVQKL